MALCATTALAGAVPRLCVRGARGRFGGFGPVPGVVSLCLPPPRPACSALRVAGRPVRMSLTLARWYAIPRVLCVPRARSGCPSGSPRVSLSCVCARALAASAPPPLNGVACAPRVVPALGAGRAIPRGPCPSACPAPVPCSVWRAWGGGGPVPVPPYLAWGCGGGSRASPGGVPSTIARGAWGHAIPLPRLPAHWAGCRGPRSTCRGRGCAGVGALLCPLGRHALWGLRAAGRVRGVHVLGGGPGGGGACAVPPGCAARGGPVGRGVALPHSVPLPSLGRQQSGCHRRCAVHGGRGPPYHSGSCSPGFSGYDLCGVLARRRGLACSSRPPWEPAAGAGGRVALWLLSRAGGDHPPCLRGWGPGPPRLAGRWGGGGGDVAPRPPCSPSGRRPAVLNPGPLRVTGALPSGVRVRSGSKCRPGLGGGEGRPVDRSSGGPCRPEPPLCPP